MQQSPDLNNLFSESHPVQKMNNPISNFDFNNWLIASRPKTLPAAAASTILGTALAYHDGRFFLPTALAALLISILMQVGANFANDLYDFQRGADTEERLGPVRVTQAGLLSPTQMKRGIVVVFGISVLLGFYLAIVAGWIVIIIGILAILAALAYTGGPFPYGYHSLGDIFVFIFFGFAAVCGTYFVQAHTVTIPSLLGGFAIGLLITNILVINNLRDIETDRRTGKITLAVKLGEKGTKIEYLICLCLAYLVPLILISTSHSFTGSLLSWLSFPLAVKLLRNLYQVSGRELNRTLAETAQLALIYALLFSIGILLFP